MKSLSLSALLALGSAGVAWAEPAWTTLSAEAGEDVIFTDIHHGFYGTGEGDLFRTQDGGLAWERIWSQPGLRSLAFLDASRGFLGADRLYETRDGGLTWQPADTGAAAAIIGVIGVTRPDCIHAAGGAQMLRSVNGGQSWTRIDLSGRVGTIHDVAFLDRETGFVSDGILILKTGDGGLTWREVHRGGGAGRLSFPTAEIGYAVLGQRLAKTVDGGESWTELPLPEAARAIGFLTAEKGWVGGFETEDGGRGWKPSALAKGTSRIRTPMVYAIGGEVQIYR
jgi:photosystem II stability/assembly factor-like uncharacterized protein